MSNRPRSVHPFTASAAGGGILRATGAGTARYRSRFEQSFAPDYFRTTTFRLSISSIGIGTYLGDSTDEEDQAYETAIRRAVERGINLIDTAINYRSQRSEQATGAAIRQLIASGITTREELVVCTKGGYIPFDRTPPATRSQYQEYLKREFVDPQIVHSEELVGNGHSLAPRFLRYCLAKSRQNLGLRTIDVYYLHNPEQQLSTVPRDEWRSRLLAAFEVLEEASERDDISVYGVATWEGLRVPPEEKGHVELEELVDLAHEVGGDGHHFRVVQAPINLAMSEAVRTPTQMLNGRPVTVLQAAEALGLTVVGSATLMQAKLAAGLPDSFRAHFPDLFSDAQRAIAYSRAIVGVTSSLVGMRHIEHVDENLGAATVGSRTVG